MVGLRLDDGSEKDFLIMGVFDKKSSNKWFLTVDPVDTGEETPSKKKSSPHRFHARAVNYDPATNVCSLVEPSNAANSGDVYKIAQLSDICGPNKGIICSSEMEH